MIRPGSPEASILALLQRRGQASAVEIGTACRITPSDVRARLVMLETMRLVVGRQDKAAVPPRRVYCATAEGRRAAGMSDARQAT